MVSPDLPPVDVIAVSAAATPERAWEALVEAFSQNVARPGAGAFATLLGCEQRTRSGPVTEVGSTLPGFRVARVDPPRALSLHGRHRFSKYNLTFALVPEGDGRVRIEAHTRASFPGPAGRAYRGLVIGSTAHRRLVTRMLRGIARAAERPQ